MKRYLINYVANVAYGTWMPEDGEKIISWK